MTATAIRTTVDPVTPPPARRRRRWWRLLTPYLVVIALLAVSGIAFAIEEPDQQDPAFLSPVSTAPTGAATLADRLRSRGIRVERRTSTPDALVAAHAGNATLFLPTPDLMHSYYLRMIKLMPATTRVVMIRPSARTLDRGYQQAALHAQRWATAVAAPGCALPAAQAAGRAAVLRNQYVGDPDEVTDECYQGAVLRTRFHATSVTFVGANEPFRNDRIDEYGNSPLAEGLLSGAPKVIWLDVHHAEPGPKYTDQAGLDPSPAPASLGRGSPDPDFPVPDARGTDQGRPEPGLPEGGGESGDRGPSMFDLFPPVAWAVLALAALAAVLAAAARARRITAPVPEPLPVVVPSTETVTGRGRLYARSRDRAAALRVLREAAHARLAWLLDQPADVAPATLVEAVATHSRQPADQVEWLLFGSGAVESDTDLVATAAALDSLIAAVTRVPEGEPRD